MDCTTTRTRPPPLLRLPAEIRVQIYDHLDLIQDAPISIYDAGIRPPSIGRVCKVLREEAMDSFFGRNRFIVSNTMALSATLERITGENVSRIAHLRLQHLGCDSVHSSSTRREYVLPGLMHVDIDILREPPWFRVTGRPLDVATIESSQDPTILTFIRGKGLLVNDRGLARFDRLPEIKVRLLLVPMLVTNVLHSIVRGTDGQTLMSNQRMLEFLVQNWLWISHILTCTELEPSTCKHCVRALGWLSA